MLPLQVHLNKLEAGTDEAGRGCLAGPVVAAAVILPKDFKNELLNDSKKLTEKNIELLRPIIEKEALAYAVAFVYQEEIDQINILRASITAMHRAIDKLKIKPEYISVDGNKFVPYKKIPHKTVIKGDGKYLNIAAASILAKTYRDHYMIQLDKEFPQYDWKNNKGYPTKKHREAIRKFGSCEHHRKTFKLLPDQLKLDL
jgi:ribonuclease HII